MAKFPENGTPAEQAAHMREWGCGGCQRGALTIDSLAAENAALRAELAFARSTGDESALEYHALKERLAEAEALLEIVAPLAYAQWKSGSCDPVEAVVGLNEPITGIADSAAPAHVPDAHKCSFCAVGLVEMEYLRGKWWHIGTDTYDLCTAGVTVTASQERE